MRKLFSVGLLLLFGVSVNAAAWQSANSQQSTPAADSPHHYSIRTGTFAVELIKPLRASKLQTGDEVTAVLEKDLLRDGKLWIPKGSKVFGHVVEVKSYGKPDHESNLRIVFDRVVSKTGDEIAFESPAVVLAVAPDKRAVPEVPGSAGVSPVNTAPFGVSPVNTSPYDVSPVNGSVRRAYFCDSHTDQTSFELAVRGSDDSLGAVLTPSARGALCMGRLELKDDSTGMMVNKYKNVFLEYGTQMVIAINPAKK